MKPAHLIATLIVAALAGLYNPAVADETAETAAEPTVDAAAAPDDEAPVEEPAEGDTEESEVPTWTEDPFKHLEARIADVAVDLARPKTDEPVQVKERKLLKDMDLLIELLEKSCSGSGTGAGANPSSPRAASVLSKGPGGQGELRNPGAAERDWAELPPREREKVLQSQAEGFPPGYEAVLGDYFRRLSEDRPETDEPPDAADANDAPEEPR